MSRSGKALYVTLCVISGYGVCLARTKGDSLVFSSEDEIVRSFVSLPPEVLQVVFGDKEDFPKGPPKDVKCEPKARELQGDSVPLLLCRSVPLATGTGGENFLVIGGGSLRGAHVVPFWLVHRDGHGVSLLFKTRADQIEITKLFYNGYAELRADFVDGGGSEVVTDSFRYEHGRYARYARKTERQ